MNVRKGLFRLWIVVSIPFLLGVCIVAQSNSRRVQHCEHGLRSNREEDGR